MKESGTRNPNASLADHGIKPADRVYWNTTPEKLIEHSICNHDGALADSGALAIRTGTFTGRSPKDRFIVEDDTTRDAVDWNKINQPFAESDFMRLRDKVRQHLNSREELYVKDCIAGADPAYQLRVRLIAEMPWSAQFAHNMFLRPDEEQLKSFSPEWTIFCAPTYKADPAEDGTKAPNFAVISFAERQIIIGGSGYTGEIKKGIFSVLNFLLPHQHGVLSMHCSANEGTDGVTAVFFGLSGTGKTTLSADPERSLIGDDEHGWDEKGVFNFEGGCYAKVIDLTEEKEPDIYRAIKHGAILENINFVPGTRTVDFGDESVTQNTRVSYPIHHIQGAKQPSRGGHPNNIFFLTADAFGVLPPISKLTKGQAMYHFISGYTAKVAGTEAGVDEPQATFSACFGAPFLPLHPTKYAEMLGEQMERHGVNIWLINTGWSGGAYGTGSRIKLPYTRAMVSAVLQGTLSGDEVTFSDDNRFGLAIPNAVPGVPANILNPRNTWTDKEAYDEKADYLAELFSNNFEKYAAEASDEIRQSGPRVQA